MPKLNKKLSQKVNKAEAVTGEFPLLAPGKYIATLNEVEAKNSAAGNPMWVAEFGEITDLDGDAKPGRMWYNLNLPTADTPPEDYDKGEEKWLQYQRLCEGRIKAFFEAFGYEVDSDTDEMVGDKVTIVVGTRTIQKGERAGEKVNSLNAVKALDPDDVPDGGGGDDDNF